MIQEAWVHAAAPATSGLGLSIGQIRPPKARLELQNHVSQQCLKSEADRVRGQGCRMWHICVLNWHISRSVARLMAHLEFVAHL